jgi:hypothetical protein
MRTLPATDEMRTLARLRGVIDPLDLAVGESFQREEIPRAVRRVVQSRQLERGHVTLNEKEGAHVFW